MSWAVNSFFKKSQAVKQPHFIHDNFSFKLQRNADLPSHLPRWRKWSIRPKLGNNPVYDVEQNIQDG